MKIDGRMSVQTREKLNVPWLKHGGRKSLFLHVHNHQFIVHCKGFSIIGLALLMQWQKTVTDKKEVIQFEQ